MKALKVPQSYEGQLESFKGHGLIISDSASALNILKHINYYRLSAYGIGLTIDDEHYKPNITIEHLYDLYQFDSVLRTELFKIIEFLEIELRTKIAYHLAIQYGAEAYRDPANFENKTDAYGRNIHTEIIRKFDRAVKTHSNLPCVKHHVDEYGGHFEVWCAVELFSFGMLSSLYSIMHKDDRKHIADQYKTRPPHLRSWILSLVEIRNLCAHYNRIYNMPLSQAPFLFAENKKYASNKLFPVILTIKQMTKHSPDVWASFRNSLISTIDSYPIVEISFLGFPNNWKEVLCS